jgi:ribose-phosphate pyrophosphokinase
MINGNRITLFAGNSNSQLAQAIGDQLGISLGDATLDRFNDGEIKYEINENVRDSDVYIIQSTCPPVNENLMELLVMTDAIKRSSAKRITAVIPYFGYARQDRKDKKRVSITARLVANMLEASGIDRVITVHLHSAQVQGFFDIPLDHLYTSNILLDAIRKDEKKYTVVSADAGGVKRSRVFAELLDGAPLAIIDKRRGEPGEAEVMHIIGDVADKDCLITEDMIDTGGTLITAAEALKNAGAKSISVCASHAVFSQDAKTNLANSVIDSIVVSDSIPNDAFFAQSKMFTTVSLAPLLSDAIKNVHEGKSISVLFD